MLMLLSLAFIIWTPAVQGQQTPYALQVGAGGDDASRGSSAMSARIRTHVYHVSAEYGNSFWLGDILANGAFVQFGYQLASANLYCLHGQTIGVQTFCDGSADTISDNDARWFWQYWPDPNFIDFYFGIGPSHSAGSDKSWHLYQILPNQANGWTFALDGKPVSSMNDFKWAPTRDPLLSVAEEVTNSRASASGRLGPVEFSDLSYSNKEGWHQVESLQAVSVCIGASSGCNVPYGLKVLGANHIIAGTGEQSREDGELLWTATFSLDLSIPFQVQVLVDHTPYDSGTVPVSPGLHTITVPSIIDINDTSRLRFQKWSDGSSDPSHSMNVSSNVSLEPLYTQQFKLTIISPFSNIQTGWYDQDTIVKISKPSSQAGTGVLGLLGAKFEFVGWYEDGRQILPSGQGDITMSAAHTLVEGWTMDYRLPIMIVELILGIVAILAFRTIYRKSPE